MRITSLLFVDSNAQAKLVFMADKGKSEDMTTIGSLIKQAMADQQVSTREVDRLTEQAGHRIAYSAVSRIRSGRQAPTSEQLQVLAKVLKVPVKRLRAAMGMSDRFTLPEYADRLSTKEREAIRNLIQVMVESKDEREPYDSQDNVYSPGGGVVATTSLGQFNAIDTDAEFDQIAARNRRDGDPGLDEDVPLDDA